MFIIIEKNKLSFYFSGQIYAVFSIRQQEQLFYRWKKVAFLFFRVPLSANQ